MSETKPPIPLPFIAFASVLACALASIATTIVLCKDFSGVALGDIPLVIWPIVPYLILAGISWRFRRIASASITMLMGTIAISIFGVYVYLDVFVLSTHHSSTEGLIIIFIPGYQIIGAVLLSGIAYLARMVSQYLIRRREGRKI